MEAIADQTLNPSPRIHAMWLATSSLHLSSASTPAWRKQSSRADFVCGHAQHLERDCERCTSKHHNSTHGFKPCGFSGFILGSVGSNFTGAGAGDGVQSQDTLDIICYCTLENGKWSTFSNMTNGREGLKAGSWVMTPPRSENTVCGNQMTHRSDVYIILSFSFLP